MRGTVVNTAFLVIVLGWSASGCAGSRGGAAGGLSSTHRIVFSGRRAISLPTNATVRGMEAFSSGKKGMIAGAGRVFLTWSDDRDGDSDVWFARSLDNGASFGDSIKVNTDDAGAIRKRSGLAADGVGNVYVVWDDNRSGDLDVYLAVSHDNGATFTPEILVNTDGYGTTQNQPSVVCRDDGTVFVFWKDGRSGRAYELYAARYTGFGAVKELEQPVFGGGISFATVGLPNAAVDLEGGEIYLAFEAREVIGPGAGKNIYFARSLDNGTNFGIPLVVNDNVGATVTGNIIAADPSIAAAGDNVVYVSWYDFRADYARIYVTRSLDGGRMFNANVAASDSAGVGMDAERPSLSSERAGKVCVAWQQTRRVGTTAQDIYAACSTDDGQSWTEGSQVDGDAGDFQQIDPNLSVDDSGRAHVFWIDERDPAGIYHNSGQ